MLLAPTPPTAEHDTWIRTTPARLATRVRHWPAPTGAAHLPPALLLHGLGVSSTYLAPLARVLARTREVFVPDIPGHGLSQPPDHTLTIADWVAVLADLLDQVAPGPVLVVANSFGCQVAVELAIARPDLVGAEVLVGSTTEPVTLRFPRHVLRLAANQLNEPLSLKPLQAFDYVRTGPVRVLQEFHAGSRHDMAARIAFPSLPLLLMRGGRDYISPAHWNDLLAANARRGSRVDIAGEGHAVFYGEPEPVARRIAEWEENHD